MAAMDSTATSVLTDANRSTRLDSVQAPIVLPLRRGVLIADDDASIRLLLETALNQHGFTVWAASDGKEALDLYEHHRRDIALVLLDVRMPVLDGPQTAAVLRRLEPGLTLCFMSGHSGDYSLEQLLKLGAACIFEKPFSMTEAVETIEYLTQHTAVKK
jgi:two-component system, cell cycle sensor histidine kinase and response regulator CckA